MVVVACAQQFVISRKKPNACRLLETPELATAVRLKENPPPLPLNL